MGGSSASRSSGGGTHLSRTGASYHKKGETKQREEGSSKTCQISRASSHCTPLQSFSGAVQARVQQQLLPLALPEVAESASAKGGLCGFLGGPGSAAKQPVARIS